MQRSVPCFLTLSWSPSVILRNMTVREWNWIQYWIQQKLTILKNPVTENLTLAGVSFTTKSVISFQIRLPKIYPIEIWFKKVARIKLLMANFI